MPSMKAYGMMMVFVILKRLKVITADQYDGIYSRVTYKY